MILSQERSFDCDLRWKKIIISWMWAIWNELSRRLAEMWLSWDVAGILNSKWVIQSPSRELLLNLSWNKSSVLETSLIDINPFDFVNYIRDELHVSPVFIDVSSNSDESLHFNLVQEWIITVTANKSSALLDYEYAKHLMESRIFWYEWTVMAWQWAIARLSRTRREMLNWYARINSVEWILSWTLAFISKRLSEWIDLSEAIKEAIIKWFTESNPMDDLDGNDVAKKLVFIARTLWYPINISDVIVEWLLDNSFRKVFIDIKAEVEKEFLWQDEKTIKWHIADRFSKKIKESWADDKMRELLSANSWKALRYMATITFDSNRKPILRAWLQFVDSKSEMWVADSNKIVVNIARWENNPNNHFIIWWNWAWIEETVDWVTEDLRTVLSRR